MASQAEAVCSDLGSTIQKRCVESVADFSCKLYSILREENKNIFFSPLSIAACLQMVYHGAKGSTKQQAGEVLGQLGIDDSDILSFYHDLILNLNKVSIAKVSIANNVWIKDNFHVLDSYKALLQDKLHADISRNSFSDPQKVSDEVNSWVAKSTKNMIKELIDPSMINDLTRLILCNAIYFKGLWFSPFEASDEEDFHLNAKEKKKVEMMRHHSDKSMLYGENDTARWVIIPYKGRKEVSMMIVLPQVPYQLSKVEDKMMKPGRISEWYKKTKRCDVNLKLPKFKFQESYDLKDMLIKLGVTDMFGRAADFSGINDSDPEGLFVSAAVHKTTINVDMAGTEAAAATASYCLCCVPPPIIDFFVDQPFLFYIIDCDTNLLFFGKCTEPSDFDPATVTTTEHEQRRSLERFLRYLKDSRSSSNSLDL